jgi:peptidase E
MTGYHGNSRPVQGIGLIPSSNAVHYDKEVHRRPAYHAAIAGGMPGGFAAEDGAALHFVGDELARVVSSRPESSAFRVERVDREVVETALVTHYLGAAAAEPALAA